MTKLVPTRAFVLHTRAYRNTSLLVDLFTQDYGRISAVARGARRLQKHQTRIAPFRLLWMNVKGRGPLYQLIQADEQGTALLNAPASLYYGFYLNELLIKSLAEGDVQQEIFSAYQHCLTQLSQAPEARLREFEQTLLSACGYAPDLITTIEPHAYYYFSAQQGLVKTTEESNTFPGHILHAIAQQQWDLPDILHWAKKLNRLLIKHMLGGKVLNSREIYGALPS